jgi:hypothetical protein
MSLEKEGNSESSQSIEESTLYSIILHSLVFEKNGEAFLLQHSYTANLCDHTRHSSMQFKFLHEPARTEGNKNLSHNSQSPGQDLNLGYINQECYHLAVLMKVPSNLTMTAAFHILRNSLFINILSFYAT